MLASRAKKCYWRKNNRIIDEILSHLFFKPYPAAPVKVLESEGRTPSFGFVPRKGR